MGIRLTFRPATDFLEKLIKVADSLLAPWQKLEVFRAHVLPSLSHHLVSGRVQRGFLDELNTRCVEFLRQVSFVPHTTHKAFLFLENWAGELGASQLKKDADVWTVARSVHCWTAKTKSSASWPEPRGLDQATYGPLPLSKFLPSLTQGVLYDNLLQVWSEHLDSHAESSQTPT
jgi:hypothetical protein